MPEVNGNWEEFMAIAPGESARLVRKAFQAEELEKKIELLLEALYTDRSIQEIIDNLKETVAHLELVEETGDEVSFCRRLRDASLNKKRRGTPADQAWFIKTVLRLTGWRKDTDEDGDEDPGLWGALLLGLGLGFLASG